MPNRHSEVIADMIEAVDDATVHGLHYYQASLIQEHFLPGNRNRFKWPPVSREYYLRKVKKGYPPQQLVRTGELRDKTVNNGRVIKKTRGVFSIVFDHVPRYGQYLKEGAPPQKGPRDFLEPDNKDRSRIERAAQKYIDLQTQSVDRINPIQSL